MAPSFVKPQLSRMHMKLMKFSTIKRSNDNASDDSMEVLTSQCLWRRDARSDWNVSQLRSHDYAFSNYSSEASNLIQCARPESSTPLILGERVCGDLQIEWCFRDSCSPKWSIINATLVVPAWLSQCTNSAFLHRSLQCDTMSRERPVKAYRTKYDGSQSQSIESQWQAASASFGRALVSSTLKPCAHEEPADQVSRVEHRPPISRVGRAWGASYDEWGRVNMKPITSIILTCG